MTARPPPQAPRPTLGARCGWLAVCLLVVGLYGWTASSAFHRGLLPDPTEAFYNRLVEGFRSGHLYLKTEAPPGLVRLPDPYDPQANRAYRLAPPYWLHDLSYYQGRLYLYFGATPAVLLYWPWIAATGQPLSDQSAAVIFCSVAFLAGAWLLHAAWRRYFPRVSAAAGALGALAFGLAAELPVLLQRAKVYEVAISCGLAMTLLCLAALWRALHSPRRGALWLAAASLAFGLAVASRPSLVFGAAILPLAAWMPAGASRRERARRLAAALLPLALVGIALAAYNVGRFGSPWEFGQHFQLAEDRQEAVSHFSLSNLGFNLRVYFLAPAAWHRSFPFVGKIRPPFPLPPGHAPIEDPFGILSNVPWVWLALALPLAWAGRGQGATPPLRRFLLALALLFVTAALPLLAFYGTCSRYEAEFLPELVLLAGLGLLAAEAALAGRPPWRWLARAGGAALLVFSVGFTLLNAAFHYAVERDDVGKTLVQLGRPADAIPQFEFALRVMPEFAEAQVDLGNALSATPGGLPAAIRHFEAALRLDPDNAGTHFNLANCLLRTPGQAQEAIAQYRAALRLRPDNAPAHYNLGAALLSVPGHRDEARSQFEAALRLMPDSAPAKEMLERLRN